VLDRLGHNGHHHIWLGWKKLRLVLECSMQIVLDVFVVMIQVELYGLA